MTIKPLACWVCGKEVDLIHGLGFLHAQVETGVTFAKLAFDASDNDRQEHPGAGKGSSTKKFREAMEAYHTLSDPARRRQHDIDLGTPTPSWKVIAEPLFDPAMSAFRPTFVAPNLEILISDLMRVLETEFDFTSFSHEFFQHFRT